MVEHDRRRRGGGIAGAQEGGADDDGGIQGVFGTARSTDESAATAALSGWIRGSMRCKCSRH